MNSKLLFLILLYLFYNCLNGQKHSPEKFQKYTFVLECPMYKCDIEGNLLDTIRYISQIGSNFVVVFIKNDECIIRFLIKNKKTKNHFILESGLETEHFKYYKIKVVHFDFKTIPANFKNYALTFGNIITPIKLRLSPFDFSKDFTIGPSFGMRYVKNEFSSNYLNCLLGIGISSITLNSFNTRNKLMNNVEAVAFTRSFGLMIENGKSQIGIFTGIDLINSSNNNAEYFIYKNKLWLAIGFGQSLFTSK